MSNHNPLSEYMRLVHKEDCEINRNVGMSPLAEHTVNQVMGHPKCDCGLEEARQRPNRNEMDIQCEQHFGGLSVCCLVQLRHRVGISNEWQTPLWVCEKCRSHMPGQFRYCDNEEFIRHLALTKEPRAVKKVWAHK